MLNIIQCGKRKFFAILGVSVLAILLAATCFFATGCEEKKKAELQKEPVKNGNLDYTFQVCQIGLDGNVSLNIFGDDFNALGFTYGDSLNFSINDGKTFYDVPFYSGRYVDENTVCICDYPGSLYVWITRDKGAVGWSEGLQRGDKIRIWRNQEQKYYSTQYKYHVTPSNNRADYDSDEQFINYRAVKAGTIGNNCLLRCASPFCSTYYRDETAAKVLSDKNFNWFLDLYDNQKTAEETLKSHPNDYRVAHFEELMNNDRFLTFDINANYTFQQILEEMAKAFKKMAQEEGPYLITCKDGTDFTGYTCMVLEMLNGASYDELKNDFMKSYENYYGLTEQSNKELYDYLVKEDFDVCLANFTGIDEDELKTCSPETFKSATITRLNSFGTSEEDIDSLIDNLKVNYE